MIIHVVADDPGFWSQIFNYDNYGELLGLVTNSLIAGAVLGVVGGLISVVVMMRDLAFAVHGIAELSFAGASAALLAGVSVAAGSLAGSIVAALVIGALGVRAADRNSAIGVLMPFGLGPGGQQVRPAHRTDRRRGHAADDLAARHQRHRAGRARRRVASPHLRQHRP
jgi:zinc/manganese transport system permease protein